jgi:hypothetical protein
MIAILLLIYAWWQESWIVLGLSLFTFYEALNSWCIFYQFIGRNTCPIKTKEKAKEKQDENL